MQGYFEAPYCPDKTGTAESLTVSNSVIFGCAHQSRSPDKPRHIGINRGGECARRKSSDCGTMRNKMP
jgi:hypothetical protein